MVCLLMPGLRLGGFDARGGRGNVMLRAALRCRLCVKMGLC